ncbi:MAG: roadblock/LC7 domain-containing protein [Acidobacteria bacterium]|nr:MAG: roadblock/LC7 domain-containing protein [Acidobacteriota bacterium]
MAGSELILHEEDFLAISGLADDLLRRANARFVAVIDRNGQPIAWSGVLRNVDRTALASLAAGNVAATETLAKMIGEPSFSTLYHEGEREHLFLSTMGEIAIMLIAFDERSSLGLVRLRVRQAEPMFREALERVVSRSRAAAAGLKAGGPEMPEITDEDIDNLFGDQFGS